jgi:hypothetical protein
MSEIKFKKKTKKNQEKKQEKETKKKKNPKGAYTLKINPKRCEKLLSKDENVFKKHDSEMKVLKSKDQKNKNKISGTKEGLKSE